MSETLTQKLIELITPWVSPLGYEIVYLEVNHRQKMLRLFIDHLNRTDGISIEDCVKVTHAFDEPLEKMSEVEQAFSGGTYELEVSSPGVDRPLRTERDYEKFKGHEVRLHTFRTLSGEEMGNADYQAKNPKQKNFLGTLQGLREGRVVLALNLTAGHDKTQKKPGKKRQCNQSGCIDRYYKQRGSGYPPSPHDPVESEP